MGEITQRGTGFVKTEVILAAQERDHDTLEHHLSDMLPGELSRMCATAEFLASACRTEMRAKRKADAETVD